MKVKHILALAAAGAVMTASLAGCGGATGGGNVVKIGGIAPLTGNVAVYGQAAKNGAQLAIDEYNEKEGGVLGKKIEFIVYDDKGDQTEAVNAYNKLVSNDKVTAILGAITSKPTLAVKPNAVKDGTPMVTPTATALEVTMDAPNIFRACYIDPYQGQVMAGFATKELSAKTAAVMYNIADDYSMGVAEAFRDSFEANGGKVVSFEGFGAEDKDFKAILTNINTQNPDTLFISEYYNTVGLIAQQAKQVGIQATMIGADGWDGVLDSAPDLSALEGTYFCNHYSTDDMATEVQDFLAAFEAKFNEKPNALAALGYDGAKIMIEAIKKANSTDKAAIVQALQDTNITSVTGTITYDESRNPVKSVAIIKIENGTHSLFTKMNP